MSKQNDQKWGELNKALLEAMKSKDWSAMSGLYNEMTYIVVEEKKDARYLLVERNKCVLLNLKEAGIKKVKISTAGGDTVCEYCSALEGKILSIDEALSTMPIPGACSNAKVFKGGKCFCRCLYLPVIELSGAFPGHTP